MKLKHYNWLIYILRAINNLFELGDLIHCQVVVDISLIESKYRFNIKVSITLIALHDNSSMKKAENIDERWKEG